MPFEIMYLKRVEYPRFFPLSEYAVVAEFGDIIDPLINARVTALCAHLEARPFPGLRELVPAYASLTVYYDPETVGRDQPGAPTWERVRDILLALALRKDAAPESGIQRVEIPVCYDPSLGADLAWVASHCGLDPQEVVDMHCREEYRVYMNGFIPGFAYLGLTDKQLDVPRRQEPVLVPAGSVALAGRQTGIYPATILGGWQVIGCTPLVMFDPSREPAVLLRPGMRVRVRPIDLDRFHHWQSHGTTDY